MDNGKEYGIYVLKVIPGREEEVVRDIITKIDKEEVQDPTFLTYSERKRDEKGNEKIVKTKVAPGYVFIKSQPIDECPELFYKIKSIRFVIGFLLSDRKGVAPMSKIDVEKLETLKQKLENPEEVEKLVPTFKVGSSVVIISGVFQGTIGSVEKINLKKGMLTVLINMFDRSTPLEINMLDVQPLS